MGGGTSFRVVLLLVIFNTLTMLCIWRKSYNERFRQQGSHFTREEPEGQRRSCLPKSDRATVGQSEVKGRRFTELWQVPGNVDRKTHGKQTLASGQRPF